MKEAMNLALEALEARCGTNADERGSDGAITALREALAQDEQSSSQEPWCMKMNGCKTKCEDCPDEAAKPQRPWVGLTDEFCITNMFDMGHHSLQIVFKSRKNADEFKAALKEKNT